MEQNSLNLRPYPEIRLGHTKENHKNSNYDNWSLDQDLKLAPPEHDVEC
jgi:hypothetical protein